MQISDQVGLIRDQLAIDVVDALGVSKVHMGRVRLPQVTLPYAVVALSGCDQDWEGVRAMTCKLTFEIYGRFALDDSLEIDEEAELMAKFDALASLIESEESYAGVGELSILSGCAFNVLNDPDEPMSELKATLQVQIGGQYGA